MDWGRLRSHDGIMHRRAYDSNRTDALPAAATMHAINKHLNAAKSGAAQSAKRKATSEMQHAALAPARVEHIFEYIQML
jgi:hypothetical protein